MLPLYIDAVGVFYSPTRLGKCVLEKNGNKSDLKFRCIYVCGGGCICVAVGVFLCVNVCVRSILLASLSFCHCDQATIM